jgi:hypothetical protein
VKRWLILPSLLATRIAAGQGILGAPSVSPPFSVDPSTSGLPPPPAPAPKPAPVMVVGPNGQVISGDQGPATPTNFYIDGGDQGPTDPTEIHAGATPELHVVRSGDTLWDICGRYFNDPWQWPKIWSYNPQITNPHWIYPGDLVRLLPKGVFADKTPTTAVVKQPDKQPDNVPPPARKTEVTLKQIAFVERSDLDRSMTLEGSVDEKVLLGTNDEVYLSYPSNKEPQVGEKYSIYEPDQPVGKVGSYVRLLGTVEVVSVKKDKRARAIITESNHEIERGVKVGPLIKAFKNVEPVAPKVDVQGSIVAMIQQDQLIGQGEVVFVDIGKTAGLEVGNRMFVVRRGDAHPDLMSRQQGQDDRRFPARALGEIVIVEVGDNVSVGLITLSVQEMALGDIAMMQKAN